MDELTDKTYERVGELINRFARMRGRTNTEVAHALLSSRTLAKHGYRHEQKGRLTETQGQAAIRLLTYWIGASDGMH